MITAITLLPLWAFMARSRVNFTFYTYQKNKLAKRVNLQPKHCCFCYAVPEHLTEEYFHIVFIVCELWAEVVERTVNF